MVGGGISLLGTLLSCSAIVAAPVSGGASLALLGLGYSVCGGAASIIIEAIKQSDCDDYIK